MSTQARSNSRRAAPLHAASGWGAAASQSCAGHSGGKLPTPQTACGHGPPVPAETNQHNLQLLKVDTQSPSFSSGQTKLLVPRSREVRRNVAEVFGRSDRTRRGRHTAGRAPPCSTEKFPKQAPNCRCKLGRSCPSSPPPAAERGAAASEPPWREATLPAARRPVLAPCRRWALPGLQQHPAAPPLSAAPPARLYAAAAKNAKRGSQKAKQEELQKKKGRGRRPLLSKPVDDVYLTWYYERPSYNVEEAVGMLKKFRELDFTYPKQFVYINVTLDMELPKKKKVDQFSSIVLLPYRFTDETNKVLVFTENEQEAEIARENGAAAVGGVELIKWILEDEIQMDFYVAVHAIAPKLIPLRGKLKRKYPSTRRNSVGHDIPKMLQFFREGLEYMVQDECLIKTRIARLDMPTEQIIANVKTIIEDICKFKPSSAGPFVKKLVIRSSTSEGLLLNLDGLLPEAEKAEEKEEETVEGDEEKPVQESVST
ncbi:39S ribosomal protein L1, mitochondrial isoform X1 [Coturnix japonica]|nr:39S ribosomal protein L1, mitochondrial isoform X1 [Coturnix japonica]